MPTTTLTLIEARYCDPDTGLPDSSEPLWKDQGGSHNGEDLAAALGSAEGFSNPAIVDNADDSDRSRPLSLSVAMSDPAIDPGSLITAISMTYEVGLNSYPDPIDLGGNDHCGVIFKFRSSDGLTTFIGDDNQASFYLSNGDSGGFEVSEGNSATWTGLSLSYAQVCDMELFVYGDLYSDDSGGFQRARVDNVTVEITYGAAPTANTNGFMSILM